MSSSVAAHVTAKNLRSVMTYLKPEIYEVLKALAEKEERSLSNFVSRIVTEWIQQQPTQGDTTDGQ